MKFINTLLKTTLLLFVITFSSCKDDSTNPSNTNNNSSSGGVQYFFDIEIGGIAHKLQGNTKNIRIKGSTINNGFRSCCQSDGPISEGWSINFKLQETLADSYSHDITGGDLQLNLYIEQPKVGLNEGSINQFLIGATNYSLDSFFKSKNIYDDFVENTPQVNPNPNEKNRITKIQLTDLGTPSYIPTGGPCPYDANNPGYFCWGETIKGSYSGTLFFNSINDKNNFNIPVNLTMKFEALTSPYY